MGLRANYIIKFDGKTSIYYSKWGADRIGHSLRYGVDYLYETIPELYQEEPTLMNNIWCEGSLLIDIDAFKILFFDCEIGYEYAFYKELLIEMFMATSCKGWQIEWAMRGQLDIGAYINYDLQELTSSRSSQDILSLGNFRKISRVNALLVWEKAGKTILYGFPFRTENLLCHSIEEIHEKVNRLPRLNYQDLDRSEILEFVVLRPEQKQIHLWFNTPASMNQKLQVLEKWADWEVNYQREGYKWLDNRLGVEHRFHEAEIARLKLCFDQVLKKEENGSSDDNGVDCQQFEKWIEQRGIFNNV